jgi:hypothetical protein
MLNTRAARKLIAARKEAADWRIKQPTLTHYHDWRAHVRPFTRNNGGCWQSLDQMPRFASANDREYYCDKWPNGIRDLGDAHEIASLRHTGWYGDSFQYNLVKGRVLQLPARKGVPQYVAGIYETQCDGVTLWPLDTFEDKQDAARSSDRRAENYAEKAREHDAEFQAEQETEELKERIAEIRIEIRALVREMKAHRAVSDAPSICATLRASIAGLRRESHKAYKRIQKLAENPWHAVESY